MNKKLLYILIIGAIVILVIALVVFLLIKDKNDEENAQFVKISNLENINFIHLSKDNQTIYFFDEIKTNFYKTSVNKKDEVALTESNFVTVKDVFWSPDNDQVLIEVLNHQYPYQNKLTPVSNDKLPEDTKLWWLYDLKTKKATQLKQGIRKVIFSPDSQKVSYSIGEKESTSVYISNPDGSGAQKIIDINEGIPIDWSKDGKNIMVQAAEDDKPYLAIVNSETKQMVAKIIAGESGKFSPDGKIIVYDAYIDYDEKKPSLYFLDDQGKNTSINLETTMEKITWFDDSKLITAISENKENFYMIDTGNEKKKIIFSIGREINAIDLIVSSDKKNLYMVSNGLLHRLKL